MAAKLVNQNKAMDENQFIETDEDYVVAQQAPAGQKVSLVSVVKEQPTWKKVAIGAATITVGGLALYGGYKLISKFFGGDASDVVEDVIADSVDVTDSSNVVNF